MTKQEIEAVFDRVRTWPEERQDAAAQMLLRMEEVAMDFYELSDDEQRALDEGEASGLASDEEVEATFNRYRLPR